MTASVLLNVMNGFAATLSTAAYADASLIFGAGDADGKGERVYFQGTDPNWNTLPVATLEFDDDVATELKQTTKTTATLGVEVRVIFDANAIPAAATLRARHTELLQRIKDAIMSSRELPDPSGPALDTDWISGGAKLQPVTFDKGRTAEQTADAWAFAVRFSIVYRHKTDDGTVAV